MNDLSIIESEFGDLCRWQQCPAFWPAKPEMGLKLIETLQAASVRTIGHSAGGHEIIAIEYGVKEPLDATNNNLHSAIAAKIIPQDPTEIFPACFYGSQRRRKPVVALQGAIHGGELTGTVAMLNLCHIIETGEDLRGKKWPRLLELSQKTRIVMIPWLNIDGAQRWPIPNTAGISLELYQRCTQGVARDGTLHRHSEAKLLFPIPPGNTAYLGSYFNDAGINLQYDFCEVERQPETIAWMKYYLDERPDGIVIWHCDSGTLLAFTGYYLPIGHQHCYSRLSGMVRGRMLREGFNVPRNGWGYLPNMGKPYVTQMDATYLSCGGLPILCELPAGADNKPFTLDEMLDIGLLTIEEILSFAHTDGLRPH